MYHHAPRPGAPDALRRIEELAPRRRERVAQADEREAGLGEHRRGERDDRLRHDEVHDVREDVAPHDVARAAADHPRAVDEHALADRQRLRPDDPGGGRPRRDADDDDDDEQRGAQPEELGLDADDVEDDRREDDREHERRQDEEEVGQAHQGVSTRPPDEARR